jgi:hypothetical protein
VSLYPYLFQQYQAHINVELCSSIQGVKYIYKYFFKGHDQAQVSVEQDGVQYLYDETQRFLNTRYVAATEAASRLKGHETTGSSHTVIGLAVHLKDRESITFRAGVEEQFIQNIRQTMLTAWLTLNTEYSEAKLLKYVAIPESYTYHKVHRKWTRRFRKSNTIGRLRILNIGHGEKWFLRLLLLHIKGAVSFQDLRTHETVLYNTFREAAEARNLLASDHEFESAI